MRRGFWTDERLKELAKLWPHKTIGQLSTHFGKHPQAIDDAYRFCVQHKKLKISSRKKGKVRVTVYAAAYADGAVMHAVSVGSRHHLQE